MEKIDLNIKASVRKFYLQTSTRKQFRYLILGGIVGVLSSISAIGFRECIGLVTDLLFDFKNGVTSFEDAIKKVPVWQLMLFPTIIGSFVAWFTKTFAAEAQGHGVPEIMEAISIRRGVIKARVVFVKIIASAASIGSGFSVGREGPSAIIGATIGSVFGQWLRFPVGRMKMLVGAGSAAGIAAVFNAPLAGTVFALELIVRNFSVNDITPIIFSAMVATVVSHYWFGDVHDLFTQVELTIHHPMEFALYAGLGLVAGLLGIIFTKTLYAVEDYAHKLKFPSYVKGAIGGLVIGLTLIYMPLLAGPANWEAIGKAMTEVHNGEVANLVLVLALLKVIITPISLATGASGGIFAPSLMIGGGLGGAYGYYAHKFFPQYTDSPGAYGVIGMGALVAAVTQAPLTAITIIFEMTHNMSVILPMIISSGIALGIFVHFMPGSIYTLKLQRRGINIEFGRERGVLENVLVKTVMETVDEFFI
ncbi:MAG: chloride channel protein [Bdellovibrionota bacterium]